MTNDPYWGTPDEPSGQGGHADREPSGPTWESGQPVPEPEPPSGRFAANDPLVTDGFGGWWSAATATVARSWRTMGVVLLIGVALPRWILGSYNSFATVDLTGAEVDRSVEVVYPGLAGSTVSVLLSLLLLYLFAAAGLAAVRTAAAEAAGGFLSLGEAFGFGFKRGGKLWLWLLLAWLTITVGLVLCALPGLWAMFALSLMIPAAAFEAHRSPYARSIQLTHSAFWGALGRLIIVVLVMLAINIAIAFVGLLLAALVAAVFAGWLAAVLIVLTEAVMALLLILPWVWALSAVLCVYAWLRGRTEPVSATSLSAEASA
jgi:hypothetical protein